MMTGNTILRWPGPLVRGVCGVFVAILLLMLGAPGIAQPCNPVIDGSYCATNSRRDISTSPRGSSPSGTSGTRLGQVGTILRQIKASPMPPDMNVQYDSTELAQKESTMNMAPDELSKLLPSAKQIMEQVALAEAEKASEAMRQKAKADAEKKALIDRLTRPSGVSEEERLKRAATIIQRAVKNGLAEVEITRFPNVMCTDRGRAINNSLEPGWEKTLTGLPKELYEFWERQLKPRGYKIKFQVVDFSGGVPGDIGITLKWG
jgi:hypothetical protein